MTHLLYVDGLPYRVLGGWVSLVRATVLWLALCLPIVTAPAATVVLLRTVDRVRAGESPPSLAESLRLLRSSFWSALCLAAVLLVGSAVVASALLGPSPGGVWDMVLSIVVVPVAATWVLAGQWTLPVLAERSDGVAAALRFAYLRAVRRPDLALASGIGAVALLAVGLAVPTTVWVPYWLTVPALGAALATTTCRLAGLAARAT